MGDNMDKLYTVMIWVTYSSKSPTPPILVGPFSSMTDAADWEEKYRKDNMDTTSRIHIRSMINPGAR